jgi:hypothetical protein
MVFLVFMLLLIGGCFTAVGGGLAGASGSGGGLSRTVDAPPSAVQGALRTVMRGDGLALTSRADNGDHYRQVVPAYQLARDPKYASLSRLGDMLVTARVHPSGAVIHTSFTMIDTGADFTIEVVPGEGGKGSVVTIAPEIVQGTGEDAERVAERLRATVDGQAREILSRVVSNISSDRRSGQSPA